MPKSPNKSKDIKIDVNDKLKVVQFFIKITISKAYKE